jgi:hypothetical protein
MRYTNMDGMEFLFLDVGGTRYILDSFLFFFFSFFHEGTKTYE